MCTVLQYHLWESQASRFDSVAIVIGSPDLRSDDVDGSHGLTALWHPSLAPAHLRQVREAPQCWVVAGDLENLQVLALSVGRVMWRILQYVVCLLLV